MYRLHNIIWGFIAKDPVDEQTLVAFHLFVFYLNFLILFSSGQ